MTASPVSQDTVRQTESGTSPIVLCQNVGLEVIEELEQFTSHVPEDDSVSIHEGLHGLLSMREHARAPQVKPITVH